MFPLKQRKTCGYNYGHKTFYTDHHLGQDYTAKSGTKLFAPFDGKIVNTLVGAQGGKTIWFKKDNVVIRFMHLSEIKCNKGDYVFEGKLIGLTGNTGSATTGSHLHIDISKKEVIISNWKNFLDPEKYEWEVAKIKPPEPPKIKEAVASITEPVEPTTTQILAPESIPIKTLEAIAYDNNLNLNNMYQVENSFDSESVRKMLKGAVWAIIPAVALALLDYVSTIQISNPILASLVVWAVPTAVNMVKEWEKGISKE